MCKGKKCQEQKEGMITIEENKYLFAKEMYQHYKELYEVALSELKFKSLNVQHLLNILEEAVVLLGKGFPHLGIAKIIDNGIDRYNMDINIHNSTIADGQTNFGDIVADIEEYDEDECDEEEYDDNTNQSIELYVSENDVPEDLFNKIVDLVKDYVNDQKN